MLERYSLLDEPNKSMFVFKNEKNGQFYGHIVQNRTEKSPAKFIFQTQNYATIELLKQGYPPKVDK